MSAMAVDTGRSVCISTLQGFAVDTLLVLIINGLVASRTSRRDAGLRHSRAADVVGSVAIDAKRRLEVSFREQSVVNTIQSFGVVVEMAALARLMISEGEFTEILKRPRRMGISRDIRVAVSAA